MDPEIVSTLGLYVCTDLVPSENLKRFQKLMFTKYSQFDIAEEIKIATYDAKNNRIYSNDDKTANGMNSSIYHV